VGRERDQRENGEQDAIAEIKRRRRRWAAARESNKRVRF